MKTLVRISAVLSILADMAMSLCFIGLSVCGLSWWIGTLFPELSIGKKRPQFTVNAPK